MNKYINKSLLIVLFILSLISINLKPSLAKSKEILISKSVNELKTTAIRAYQTGDYQTSISIWLNLLQKNNLSLHAKAELHCHLATTFQKIGLLPKAIKHWQDVISLYENSKDIKSLELLTKVLIDKAQAHSILGQTQYSNQLIKEALYLANHEEFRKLEAVAYQVLGHNHLINGNLDSAITNYSQSFSAAEKLNNNELSIIALNNLSNIYHLKYLRLSYQANFAQESGSIDTENLAQQSSLMAKEAWHRANQAVKKSESKPALYTVEAKLHLLKLLESYAKAGLINDTSSKEHIISIKKSLLLLPPSVRKAQALIELTKYQKSDISSLNSALEIGRQIGHLRTQSLALGYLGSYYLASQNYDKALELTYQAQRLASQTRATDILYRWDWQKGRILSQLKQDQEAQLAYQQAINSLQLIRNQIATKRNTRYQIDFKLEVEPVYRELMELLLKENSGSKIKHVLEIKQLLQLSQLENFFEEDCIIVKENQATINSEQNNTTRVHTVILNHKTYIILELPNGKLKKFLLPISSSKIVQLSEKWRYDLENQENDSYLHLSQKLYQILIENIEPELAKTDTQKLLFINDGILRNVPMSALHDGKQFLIEKYTVSNSLGFNIQSQASENHQKAKILAFGLPSGSKNLPALPYVNQEIERMETSFAANTFLGERFNSTNFQKNTRNEKYNVIHIATHGKFGGTAEQTYLQAYQEKITLRQFEQILNQRIDHNIDLLTLTACDTAVGNNRAVLGLAGMAIRTNISNVLGTLWSINDAEIVHLISNFYYYWLKENYSKSEALRLAQVDMIKDPNYHAALWSSLILIEK